MRKGKRLLCGALALLMVLSLLTAGAVQQAYAAAAESQQSEEQKKEEEQKKAEEQKQRQAEMDELEKQKQEKKKNLEDLRKQIAEAKSKKEDVMGTKNLLDQQNQILMEQIDDTKQQIDLYAQQIEAYQEMEEEQYSLFCQQVRSEEERGSLSYWSVLFKATSIADLLNRLEFVNEVAEYDRNLIEAIRQTRENIKTDKAAMEEQEALLSQQQDELQKQVDDAAALIAEYASTQKGYEALAAAEEKEAKEIEAKIKKLLETSDVTPSPGGFIWPVSTSKIITSPMGGRVSPGGIGSTNHRGVDIGGVGTTSAVMATKSGKVVLTRVVVYGSYGGSGYGNYVVVDHGGGYTTLYAHMTSISVSEGQMVAQGDTLGITGSTGNSTGPHLHYEVMIKGVNQNPLDYLPGYIARW